MKIAMKCNQEQWDSIKDKLVGCELVGVGNFVTYDYLINYRFGNKNHITNYTWLAVRGDDAEIHAEWNEQVFLKACGIETEKTYKGSEFQFYSEALEEWVDVNSDYKYRLKPNNTAEIEALEQQKLEIDKQINKLK